MEQSKKVILAALVAAPLLTAASGQAFASTAQTNIVDVAQGHITVDHLGRPSVNGLFTQTVVKDSPDDLLTGLWQLGFGCSGSHCSLK